MLHIAELRCHTYDLRCLTKDSLYPAGKSSHNSKAALTQCYWKKHWNQMTIWPTANLWGIRNSSHSRRLQLGSCTSLAGTTKHPETGETHTTLAKKARVQWPKIPLSKGLWHRHCPAAPAFCATQEPEPAPSQQKQNYGQVGPRQQDFYFLKYEELICIFPNYFWGKSIFLPILISHGKLNKFLKETCSQ